MVVTNSRNRPNHRPLPRTLDEDQFRRLMAHQAVDTIAERRDRCAILTMWEAGMRIAETVSLSPGDIAASKDGTGLHVRKGKGERPRYVFIGENLAGELHTWVSELPAGTRALFPVLQGKGIGNPISTRYLRRIVASLSERSGVYKLGSDGESVPINPHMLRHSYATRLLSRGVSLREVQYQLGHRSIATTGIYTHIQNSQLAGRIQLALDDGRHVDSVVAAHHDQGLERRVARALGEREASSAAERVALASLARGVQELGVQEVLTRISTPAKK